MDTDLVITTDAIDYLRKLPDESFDVVLMDPPYPNGPGFFKKDLPEGKYAIDLATKKARKRVIFFWSPKHAPPMVPQGWYLQAKMIWHKRDAVSGIKYEEIHVWEKYVRGEPREFLRWDVYDIQILGFNRRHDFHGHPTEKPVELMRAIIKDFTDDTDSIIDCFGGSGSTGVAAKQLRRHFIILEHDEMWATKARERLEKTKPWRSWNTTDETASTSEPEPLPTTPATAPTPAAPTKPVTPRAPVRSVRLSPPVKRKR